MKSSTFFRAALAYALLSLLVSCAPTDSQGGASKSGAVSIKETKQNSYAYAETVEYKNPSGSDKVDFSLTVEDGIIQSIVVVPQATNEVSKKLQERFRQAAVTEIVGKPMANLDVHAVGGASLTTQAFEEFLVKAAEKGVN